MLNDIGKPIMFVDGKPIYLDPELQLRAIENERHVLALKREVRLLNRALGRKKRKINRLRENLDATTRQLEIANGIVTRYSAEFAGAKLVPITLDKAFDEYEAQLAQGVAADPGIEVGGTTHGIEHGA